jgi:hypothetical protein
MDIDRLLAENANLIDEAEEALAVALELAALIRPGVAQSADPERGAAAIRKLHGDLIEIRGQLLTQQNLLRKELKLRA